MCIISKKILIFQYQILQKTSISDLFQNLLLDNVLHENTKHDKIMS